MLNVLKNTCLFLLVSGLGSILILVLILLYFGRDLPDYNQLAHYEPPVVTRIHAGDGHLFKEYATEKRVFVPINTIPKHIVHTFLAVEDKNFYEHFGIDITGFLRAAIFNMFGFVSGKKSIMGGSTITQQVAKNFLLTHEKTIVRKIKEAILSLRIERAFRKEKILELYLNEIYLGSGTYGIAAAALHYFNRSLDELSIAEAAFLAALPKAPNNYHPARKPQAALTRRNWVLSRMLAEGIITGPEAIEAKKTPIILRKRQLKNTIDAKYFAEEVRRSLITTYGEKALYQGGLSVRTTLNSQLQKIADSALKKGLITYDHRHGWRGAIGRINDLDNWQEDLAEFPIPKGIAPWKLATILDMTSNQIIIGFANGEKGKITFDSMKWARRHYRTQANAPALGPVLSKPQDILEVGDVILTKFDKNAEDFPVYTLQQIPEINGAVIVMDPHTGRILAMSGGFDYERSEFNRATQAMRQAGSAFKPFAYLAALEQGYSPASLLLDAPFVMQLSPDQPLWRPQNIEKRFFGVTTLRVALEKSFNVALVRLANEIGMDKVVDVAHRFKIYTNMLPYLSTVLGSEETTLLRFTTAYAMLVNGGRAVNPILIDRIQDRHGKTIFKGDDRPYPGFKMEAWDNQLPPQIQDNRAQVADPSVIYQIVSILEGATKNGTARKVTVPGKILAAKTGTSNDYKDTWCMGFSRDLVVGVFVGFDTPKSLGRYNTGGSVAGPIFQDIMAQALKNTPSAPFRKPKNINFVRVNQQTGERTSPHDAQAIFEAFRPGQNPNKRRTEMNPSLQKESISGIY